MTPADHIARAEKLLAQREPRNDAPWADADIGYLVAALAHVGIAIAVELGAPHVSGDTVAAPGG